MIRSMVALGLMVLASPGFAQTADKPIVAAGDTWTYRTSHQQGLAGHERHDTFTVERAGATEILLSIKEVGSTLPPREQLIGADWSRFRNVDGKDVVVNRPFDFPLSPGKSWEIEYQDDHPSDHTHSSERFKEKYVVTGWEDVVVPAGSFKALKVEMDGHWTATLATAIASGARTRTDAQGSTVVVQTNKTQPQTVTGRLYKAFWYVPSVKRMVKADEEYFSTSGERSEVLASELESYKVGE